MSTYDGAYSSRGSDEGARVCSCGHEINDFCMYHGKFPDGKGYRVSLEHQQNIKRISDKDDGTWKLYVYD